MLGFDLVLGECCCLSMVLRKCCCLGIVPVGTTVDSAGAWCAEAAIVSIVDFVNMADSIGTRQIKKLAPLAPRASAARSFASGLLHYRTSAVMLAAGCRILPS